jgi:hypothetical protein
MHQDLSTSLRKKSLNLGLKKKKIQEQERDLHETLYRISYFAVCSVLLFMRRRKLG